MPACTSKTSRVHDLHVAEAHGTFSLLITNTANCLVICGCWEEQLKENTEDPFFWKKRMKILTDLVRNAEELLGDGQTDGGQLIDYLGKTKDL